MPGVSQLIFQILKTLYVLRIILFCSMLMRYMNLTLVSINQLTVKLLLLYLSFHLRSQILLTTLSEDLWYYSQRKQNKTQRHTNLCLKKSVIIHYGFGVWLQDGEVGNIPQKELAFSPSEKPQMELILSFTFGHKAWVVLF